MKIEVAKIKGRTISEIIQELEGNNKVMDHIRAHNLNGGDYLESIASHLYYTNTDYTD